MTATTGKMRIVSVAGTIVAVVSKRKIKLRKFRASLRQEWLSKTWVTSGNRLPTVEGSQLENDRWPNSLLQREPLLLWIGIGVTVTFRALVGRTWRWYTSSLLFGHLLESGRFKICGVLPIREPSVKLKRPLERSDRLYNCDWCSRSFRVVDGVSGSSILIMQLFDDLVRAVSRHRLSRRVRRCCFLVYCHGINQPTCQPDEVGLEQAQRFCRNIEREQCIMPRAREIKLLVFVLTKTSCPNPVKTKTHNTSAQNNHEKKWCIVLLRGSTFASHTSSCKCTSDKQSATMSSGRFHLLQPVPSFFSTYVLVFFFIFK